MSNYFQVKDADWFNQIDDTHAVQSVLNTGEVTVSNEYAYGMKLDISDGSFYSFKAQQGITLYFTPVTADSYNSENGVIIYIMANTETKIRWYKWGKAKSTSNSTCGMQIFNKDGELVYDSNYLTGNFSQITTITNKTPMPKMRRNRDDSYNLLPYAGGIKLDMDVATVYGSNLSVIPIMTPWTCDILDYMDFDEKSISRCSMAGYVFSDGSISTQSEFSMTTTIKELKGDGALEAIRVKYFYYYIPSMFYLGCFDGIQSYSYMFSTVSLPSGY